jgi:hypothetical protein
MESVFISFIHEEETQVRNVRGFLKTIFGERIDAFMSSDQTAIYAGEEWMARIFEELKTAKVLISMLSPTSVRRPWINFEAGAAWMGKAKVIPVCYGGLTIGDLPKPYSSLQAVEIGTSEGCYYLTSSIAHHLGIEPPEKPFFSPFPDAGRLAGRDLDRDKEVMRPYAKLALLMGTLKDERPPTRPTSE